MGAAAVYVSHHIAPGLQHLPFSHIDLTAVQQNSIECVQGLKPETGIHLPMQLAPPQFPLPPL